MQLNFFDCSRIYNQILKVFNSIKQCVNRKKLFFDWKFWFQLDFGWEFQFNQVKNGQFIYNNIFNKYLCYIFKHCVNIAHCQILYKHFETIFKPCYSKMLGTYYENHGFQRISR